MTDIFEQLAAPFPEEKIHWRGQSLTQDGNKAMAVAYVDARDVMGRLDDVVGPDKWSDTYHETTSGRVICNLKLQLGDEWVSKADGAGSTQMEGDKGGISDAFKRAGVKWGIARYLYDMPAVWVPCEYYERNGKKHWKKWREDPWSYAKAAMKHPNGVRPGDESGADKSVGVTKLKDRARKMSEDLGAVDDEDALEGFLRGYAELMNELKKSLPDWHKAALDAVEAKREQFKQVERLGA